MSFCSVSDQLSPFLELPLIELSDRLGTEGCGTCCTELVKMDTQLVKMFAVGHFEGNPSPPFSCSLNIVHVSGYICKKPKPLDLIKIIENMI